MIPSPRRSRAGAALAAAALAASAVLASCSLGSGTTSASGPAGVTSSLPSTWPPRPSWAPTDVPSYGAPATAAGAADRSSPGDDTEPTNDPRACARWVEPRYDPIKPRPPVGPFTTVLRTDRSDDRAWAAVQREVVAGARAVGGSAVDFRFVDDEAFQGLQPGRLLAEDSDDYQGRYLVLLADRRTMREPGHPLVAVLLLTDGRRPHRTTARAAAELLERWDLDVVGGTQEYFDRVCELEAASGPDGVYRG